LLLTPDAGIQPGLENGARRGLIDSPARFSAPESAGGQRTLRLHCGQPLIPELHGSACRIGDLVGNRSGVTCSGPLSSPHVERQPHDEPDDAMLVRKIAKGSEEHLFVSRVEDAARVCQKAEIVVDCQSNAHTA
jgi:hypothetical protein